MKQHQFQICIVDNFNNYFKLQKTNSQFLIFSIQHYDYIHAQNNCKMLASYQMSRNVLIIKLENRNFTTLAKLNYPVCCHKVDLITRLSPSRTRFLPDRHQSSEIQMLKLQISMLIVNPFQSCLACSTQFKNNIHLKSNCIKFECSPLIGKDI